jgi:hypothetical protein
MRLTNREYLLGAIIGTIFMVWAWSTTHMQSQAVLVAIGSLVWGILTGAEFKE